MKIHYFQRYHSKENVATANTMLLLSRLYSYSSDKFFRFLKSEYFADGFEPEIIFNLQEKSKHSVPDATITQEGFKIVVETKMTDWFYSEQLMKHLESFGDEKNKVLITLCPEPMGRDRLTDFENKLKEYNAEHEYPVLHVNTTFEKLANAVQNVIDERDYEMQDILDDYLNYCYNDNLIPVSDSWKWMRVQLANTTFDFNIAKNLYYDGIDRGFRKHDYLGLYKDKSVRAVGKISAIVTAVKDENGELIYNVEALRDENGELSYKTEEDQLTQKMKDSIDAAIADGKKYGYKLDSNRYFFVEHFYETDFRKTTPHAPMGSRLFDLTKVLKADFLPETTEVIAEQLKNLTWE